MVIDQLMEQIKRKKNPCIVGIDPEWSKLPDCYKMKGTLARKQISGCHKENVVWEVTCIMQWAIDVIDAVADVVPAVNYSWLFLRSLG